MRPVFTTTWFLALCAAQNGASAALITVPTDLVAGDEYRLIFVTGTQRNATDSAIATYNSHVSNAVSTNSPVLHALGTNWTAIVSTSLVNAITNTNTDPSPFGPTGVPIYLVSGGRVANDYDDLWDGTILLNIDSDETGAMGVSDRVWTGSNTGGTASSPLGGAGSAKIGNSAFSDLKWVNNTTQSKNNSDRFYGISDVLTVPIPEPHSAALLMFGVAFFLALRAIRRSRAANDDPQRLRDSIEGPSARPWVQARSASSMRCPRKKYRSSSFLKWF